MRISRNLCTLWAVILGLTAAPRAAGAVEWIFDPDQRLAAGPSVRQGSAIEWAASSFALGVDAYASVFSLAAMKLYGPDGAGFDVSLVETNYGVPDPGRALATWTVAPTDATPRYYDTDLGAEVFISGDRLYSLLIKPNSSAFAGGLIWMQHKGHSGWGTSDAGQTWNQLAFPMCLRVGGRVVPEPAAGAGLALGTAWISAFPRRSRLRRGRTRRPGQRRAAGPA